MQLSNHPYIVNILFRDGTTRRVDFSKSAVAGNFTVFFLDAEGKESVFVNGDTVQTMDLCQAAEAAGRA